MNGLLWMQKTEGVESTSNASDEKRNEIRTKSMMQSDALSEESLPLSRFYSVSCRAGPKPGRGTSARTYRRLPTPPSIDSLLAAIDTSLPMIPEMSLSWWTEL